MRIRLATRADAEPIRLIYNLEVDRPSTTFDLVPRSPADQQAWMARHTGAHPVVVAVSSPADAPQPLAGLGGEEEGRPGRARVGREDDWAGEDWRGGTGGEVLGFASLSAYRTRPAYATTVEDSVYVAQEARGQGVGRALLTAIVSLAADHGFHTVIARVVGHNQPSINLHRSCGFEMVGVEREVGRKHGHWLDVVELQLML